MQNDVYMCRVLHAIPEQELLASVHAHRIGRYTPAFPKGIGRKGQRLAQGACVMAYAKGGGILLQPLPTAMYADPEYFLTYDMALPQGNTTVAKLQGFIISACASAYAAKAQRYQTRDLAEALLNAHKAIDMALAQCDSISPQAEREYLRKNKLISLYIDQADRPEGALAGQLALRSALRIYSYLTASGGQ